MKRYSLLDKIFIGFFIVLLLLIMIVRVVLIYQGIPIPAVWWQAVFVSLGGIVMISIFGKRIDVDQPVSSRWPYDGAPCLVKNKISPGWHFRYSNGRGKFYGGTKKKGSASTWDEWRELKLNDLPIESE